MDKVIDLISSASEFPIEFVLALIALSAIGLAVFAIHAVHSIAKARKD